MNVKLKSVREIFEIDANIKIQQFFFDYPDKEFGINDLSKALNLHKNTVNKIVKILEKEVFLRVQHIGRIWRISNNQRHKYNATRKIPYHLQLIYETNLLETILATYPDARSIVLFGSYRKGDDISTSDIDIAVELLDEEEVEIVNRGTFKNLGYRENVQVNIHLFSRKKINLNLFNNIANGILLYGFLEVKPWDLKDQIIKTL